MEILAGSLNVEAGSFLHAGYLSAAPRTYERHGSYVLAKSKFKLIDVKKSVELKKSVEQAPPATAAEMVSRPLQPAMMVSDVFTLSIAFFFFAYLISFYYRRVRKLATPGWRPWLFASVPILVFACIQYWAVPAYESFSLNRLPPPWNGVPIQEYQDPQAATDAILHALIANALVGVRWDVENLAAIQNEVAFPVIAAEYTNGMKYAQKTYGRDGWGRKFSFQQLEKHQYRVASAGPDGQFDTKDDMVLVVSAPTSSWEQSLGGVYYRVAEGHEVVLIHEVGHALFRSAHGDDARKLTDTDLFDVFRLDELSRRWRGSEKSESSILAALKSQHKPEAVERKDDELLFVQLEDATQ